MILRKLRRVPAHLRPRRLRVYGVGQGKSGTTTLARMFGRYRAAHELDAEHMVPMAAAVLRGELAVDSARVRRALRWRSMRFHLEVDSAGFLAPFAGTLAQLFDDARFVVSLRDCFTWLDSRVEWEHRHPLTTGDLFEPLHAALYDTEDEFAPEEAPLREAGLRPIASYLRSWATRNDSVMRAVPADRLFVVRTEDLDDVSDALARFVGVPPGTVRAEHANANPHRVGLLAQVPLEFIVARAGEHCGDLMQAHWGTDWCDLQTRVPRGAPNL